MAVEVKRQLSREEKARRIAAAILGSPKQRRALLAALEDERLGVGKHLNQIMREYPAEE